MKKIVALALLVASLCVVGCSDTKPAPAKTPTGGAPTTPAAK